MAQPQRLYLDVHALQTLPPSNVNRDDTGSPKTAQFGGSIRARVSSQAWKKAMRDEFADLLPEDLVGSRTVRTVDLISEAIKSLDSSIIEEDAMKDAKAVLAATGIKVGQNGETGYLLFVSPRQVDALAQLAVSARKGDGKVDKKAAKSVLNVKENPSYTAVDLALFGRMVADGPDLNVDAAASVAHAIGVSRADTEFDYFVGMDDLQPEEETGATMIGTIEFLSSLLYRYATVDIPHLYENLGSAEVTEQAVSAFLKAFITSMPRGKQTTFANRTLPAAVVVELRHTQPVSLVNAFEKPVVPLGQKSEREVACDQFVDYEKTVDAAFGEAPQATYVILGAPGTSALEELPHAQVVSLEELLKKVNVDVSAFLSSFNDQD